MKMSRGLKGSFLVVFLLVLPEAASAQDRKPGNESSRKSPPALEEKTPSLGPTYALTDATYERLRDYILPRPYELKFLEIPWQPTFWNGVAQAQRQDKPLLLWFMEGHPLGES